MHIENLDTWALAPTIDLMLVDSAFADRLREECSTGDTERNGCVADRILGELLRKLGMAHTADAYENLTLLR
jgi:hypothetical protein